MRYWPHGTTHVRVDQLAVGDAVVVPGTGAYRITRLVTARPLGLVAVLGWDDLALILRPGSSRHRLNPAPDAVWHRPAAPEAADPPIRDQQHQLA
ncbi:MAG: hypothetical protein GEV07_30465 [Streptosporangiales bacterium]|nr:hypothetical protein [Streptosporangiales bacterium]